LAILIESVTIQGGKGRNGKLEPVRSIDLKMGDVVSIVGPTGSGKTTLINDIELLANANTPTGRRILINGAIPPAIYRKDPAHNPIALITQHTNFLSDLPVKNFLETHARIRNRDGQVATDLIASVISFANQLTGEPINLGCRMTELSGGQTRALLIADATVICDTPIVLLDEVENAGIHRTKALQLLKEHHKIFIFVTHDPRIVLLSDFRVIMREGSIMDVLYTNSEEQQLSIGVTSLDDKLSFLREKLRLGKRLSNLDLEALT
jgi:ABC-type lipoprotein export system ATPase subunit